MDVRGWVRALRKSWWVVVIAVSLGAGAGLLAHGVAEKEYASSVTFFVKTPSEQIGTAVQGDAFGQKRVNSYIQLLKSRRLADMISRDTGTALASDDVSRSISAKGDANTVLLTATVTRPTPTEALELATSVSTQFLDLVSDIETTAGSTAPVIALEVTSAPTLPTAPINTPAVLLVAIGSLVGLVVGLLFAVLREFFDTSVRSAEDVTDCGGGAVLCVVPRTEGSGAQNSVRAGRSRHRNDEAIRQLRTNLQYVDIDNPPKVVVISSSVAGEGKSSTAKDLGITLAGAGSRTLLIEADMRRPKVAEYLGLEGSVGLTDVLVGRAELDDVLQTWGRSRLTVLPSGAIPPNPSELLGSLAMGELVSTLRRRFDYVIIDTAPLLPVTDAAVVSVHADGVILAVRYGSTSRSQVQRSCAALEAVGAAILGSVLTMTPARGLDSYGDTYGYDPDDESSSAARRPRLTGEQIGHDAVPDSAPATPDPIDLCEPRRQTLDAGARLS